MHRPNGLVTAGDRINQSAKKARTSKQKWTLGKKIGEKKTRKNLKLWNDINSSKNRDTRTLFSALMITTLTSALALTMIVVEYSLFS